MSRILIGAVVAAFIVFVYTALSWMMLPTHKHSFRYTEGQTEIMNVLQKHLKKENRYFIPHYDPSKVSAAEGQKIMEANTGKDWAIISFHGGHNTEMGKDMGVGFLMLFISMLFLSWILVKMVRTEVGFGGRLGIVMAIAGFVIFFELLMNWNWFNTPHHYLHGDLVDLVVGPLLAGSWLAWWTNR